MRWLVLAIALCGAACFRYDPPAYDEYAFRCDDAHPCAAGQTCLGNLCQYVGASRDGVLCGSVQCPPDQQCCFDSITAFCLPALERCEGGYGSESSLCDGAEDCPMGTACCDTSSGTAACTPMICEDRVCIDSTDCGGYHYCCPNTYSASSPLKRCSSDPC